MDKYSDESIDTQTGALAPPELSTNRVRDIFSHIAKKYELFNAVSSMGAYKLWLKNLTKLANIGPTSAVIDIAGGTGDVSFAIAKRKHPAVIVCSDLVPEMLEVAKHHYDTGASDDVPIYFETADAQNLPYDDNVFDVATMAYGLRNMPERKVALAEILRVLRPGGQLLCLDFSTPTNPLWQKAYNVYLNHVIPFWGKVITGDDSGFIYLSKSIKAFPDQAGVAALMSEVGFENVEWHDCTGGIACIHLAYKPLSKSSQPHESLDCKTRDTTHTEVFLKET